VRKLGYFFWSGNGEDHTDCAKSLWRTISRLGVVADVHAHPHRFRDTFAVGLISNGADLRTVPETPRTHLDQNYREALREFRPGSPAWMGDNLPVELAEVDMSCVVSTQPSDEASRKVIVMMLAFKR
jgi:hypothetical protein